MPMVHNLPSLPSGVTLDGSESFWVDKFVAGEWQTYQISLDDIVVIASGVQLDDVNVFTKNQSVAPVALTIQSAGSVPVIASESNNFTLTLTENCTIEDPTDLTDGMWITITLIEDGTGGWTPTFGAMWKFDSATLPTWDTAAGAVNYVSAQYNATAGILIAGALVGLG
jgi:hypothetical protein